MGLTTSDCDYSVTNPQTAPNSVSLATSCLTFVTVKSDESANCNIITAPHVNRMSVSTAQRHQTFNSTTSVNHIYTEVQMH